jgi:hypothetical protein
LHAIESGRFTDLLDAARKFNLSDDDTLILQQDYLEASDPELLPAPPGCRPPGWPTPQRETCPMGIMP